jgi:hypothetical protein
MHRPIASGRLVAFKPDDTRRGLYIGAEVVDDQEWRKVLKGVYTGFSIGGDYERRWNDPGTGLVRYTALPTEISIVDAPCIKSATFDVVKATGMTKMKFEPVNHGDRIVVYDSRDYSQDNIAKALPGAQDAITSIAAGGVQTEVPELAPYPKAGQSEQVVRYPDPMSPMQVSPESPPTGDTLASRGDPARDISPDFQELINAAISENLAKVDWQGLVDRAVDRLIKFDSVHPAPQWVPVTHSRMIRVK